jgi:hypothetical protein
MSLSEETLSAKSDMPFTSLESAVKYQRHERLIIRLKTVIFLRKGGKITSDVKSPVDFRNDIQADMDKKRRIASVIKTRSTARASSGHQNFVLKVFSDGSKTYALIIGNKLYETYPEKDLHIGIAKRDRVRAELGMSKALY